MISQKVDFGGSELTSRTVLLVDQSSPDFYRQRGKNRRRQHDFPILDISTCFGDIRNRILKLSKVDQKFARFWPELFLAGGIML